VISELPLSTNFCTGHGTKKFDLGVQVSSDSWHDMNQQAILPTWQFAFSENNALTAQWDFSDAAWGGNSLKVSGNLPANQPIDLMLYKTKLGIFSPIDTFFKTNVFYKSATIDSNAKLILIFADEPTQKYEFAISGGIEFGNGWIWNENLMDLSFSTREIAAVGFRFESATAIANYSINFGGLEIGSLTLLGTSQAASKQHFVTVSYPLENKQLRFTVDCSTPNNSIIRCTIYKGEP
jgi:endo-beta-N-acetylglucosaminidase D